MYCAGIATQTVVEKKIAREQGKTRHDLGREKFLENVWAYVKEYGNTIGEQQADMGISVDWSRLAFTLDDNLTRAVIEGFVRMYEVRVSFFFRMFFFKFCSFGEFFCLHVTHACMQEGLIYRENRLVNWCCRLRTAVSDIEVDYIEVEKATLLSVPGYEEKVEFGAIVSFAYPIEGATPGQPIAEGEDAGGAILVFF